MDTTVQKWGNSLALRIPNAIAKDIHLHQGSVVEVAAVEGKIVVKPKRQRKYTLSHLLKGVNKNNRHAEQDWGGTAGREVW